jgi:CshA-type fibril repeat protein
VKLCGADDSLTPTVDESTPPNCNATSLTVPGEGTYTVNSTTGAVTFDPLETFDGTATAVRYQAADTLDRFVNSTITLIVDPPTAPVANPETKSLLPGGTATFTTITGTSGLASGTGLVTTGANATCLFTPTTTTCDADNSVTITGEGTYVLDPATGIVTFTALSSITAGTKTPITYRVTDIVGQTATSTLTPIIPPPPAATDDTSSGNYDTNQTINPLTNDAPGAVSAPLVATTVKLCGLANASATPPVTAETPPNCTKTTLTVTGEGTYTVDPTTGVVTFDPLPTFKGGATPVDYQVADSLGQITDATITVSVNDPPLPTASPDAITDAYDTNQTYTSTTNDTPGSSSFPFVASTVKLCGANDPATPSVDESVVPNCNATTLTVTGEGTYTVNPTTGVVTFDPVSSFTGTVATVVRYQVTDTLSRVANSTITPTVGAPPVPTASPDAITDAYDTNQTYTPVANDTKGAADFPFVATTVKLCGISPAQTPPSCTQTTLIVAGEGTYTVDPTTGVVTFDPVSSFTGTVGTVVRYQVTDTLSRVANSTITPTVGAPPVPTASPDAITDAYDTNQTYSPVTNDTKGAADFPFVATTVKLCGANDPATPSIDESVVPNCNATTLTVSGEGTYTVDPTTGVVTFDPVSSFTGTVGTVVKYQVADTLGRVANSTITPTVGAPPVPTASPDAQTRAHDTNQTYTPVANDTKGAADFPFVATTVKLCGANDPATPSVDESVVPNCNATTLTIAGEGTYTVDPVTGVVTFDPLPSFKGTVATVVAYQATDTLGRVADSTITPTVTPPTAPTAAPETKSVLPGGTITFTTITGSSGLATGTGLATTGATATCLIDPATPTVCSTGFTNSDGTWSINQATGVVTFVATDPLAEGTKTAVTYRVTDVTGQTATSTLTPIVPPPPGATNDISTDAYDTNQLINPLTNDSAGAASAPLVATTVKLCGISPVQTPNSCDKTTLTVPGEGTYTVNPVTGVVTFDPLPTFTGTVATPVRYQVTDLVGRTVNATITPTVTPPPVPTATPNTGRGAYDTNQTVNPITNDTPGAPAATFVPTTVKLCGISPVQTPNSCDKTTLTVPGEGTYTVNPTTGVVTFDPLPTFTGTATPVVYQVTDILNRTVSSTITLTVDPPSAPTATPETKLVLPGSSVAFTTITGSSGLATGTELVTTGATATCLFTPGTTTCDADNSVTITGEGTYVLDPATGIVTFTALSSAMSGTKPSITYRVTDIVGQTATSTLTPIIPDPPAATNDVSSGPYDTNQEISPLSNDSFSSLTPAVKATLKLCGLDPLQTPNSCDKTSLVVPNEGTYTLNSTTGVVTFDPLPSFTGTVATPPTYQVADSVGRYVNATITPTVSAPDAPTAKPETKLVLPGATISFTTTTGASGLATGTGLATSGPTATCLFTPGTTTCDADNSVTIVGEGTYVLDPATGIVTFTASATIMPGTKTPITYRVTDALGQTATSTLTPIVPAPPAATNDAISDAYDTNQTYTPLANDSFSSLAPVSKTTLKLCGVEPVQKPNDCDKTSVTVPNEGTYTLNADGTVTFDPLPTFSGTATPLVYQVADSLGRFVNATITPTVAPPPVPAATLDTGKAKQGTKITLSPWLNDDGGTVDSTGEKLALVPTSVRLCGVTTLEKMEALSTTSQNVTCSLTKLKTADGTYTVDVKTGKVSFVHKKGFSGTVTEPVKYSIANSFKGAAGPGIATGVLIPTIVPTSVPSVTLGDKVWRDLNGDGYQGPGDGGIAGVTVKVLTVKGKPVRDLFGKIVKPVVSDINGAFRFTGLPGGRYKLIVTYPENFRPTIPDRPGREKNSSTTQAITKVLKIGQSDLSLDFGMVPKMTSGLAHTM